MKLNSRVNLKYKLVTKFPFSGVKEKLDYIKDLGVDSIWLSPVYFGGGVDYGNDIVDHTKIDPLFGSDQDFLDLLTAIDIQGKQKMIY